MRKENAARGTRTMRGYDNQWLAEKAKFLARYQLCRQCEQEGRLTKATDVDHIKPHRGDDQLFWDPTNWQPLCHSCHARKTASETGGRNVSQLVSLDRKPLVPVIVVCSPSSELAREAIKPHIRANDLVLELDSIISLLSGMPLYTNTDEQVIRRALLSRNHSLRSLGGIYLPWARTLFLTPTPRAADRRHWRTVLQAKVIVLEVPPEECCSRIDADVYGGKAWRKEAVMHWWSSYVLDHLDVTCRDAAALANVLS